MDELLGTEVGNYRLIRVLGEGGMGRVYVGEQAAIASRVAIKVLTTKDPDLVARFFAEARAVNVIKHPGLVKVQALSHLPDGRPYIIMELVEGETLRTLVVRDSPLPIGGVLDMMKQLLAALGAAHARNVVHRDLKPDNVMITPDGTVKILDFGIAKLSTTLGGGNLTQVGAQIGTPAYMAPEQIRGDEVDARTDVYAAGVVLYEALTGRNPFEAASEYELVKGHLEAPPPKLSARRRDVPPALEPIIEKALAKKPADRYQSGAELSAALDASGVAMQRLRARLPMTGPRAFDGFRATLDDYPYVVKGERATTDGKPSTDRATTDGKRRNDDRASSDHATVDERPAGSREEPAAVPHRDTVEYKRPSQRPIDARASTAPADVAGVRTPADAMAQADRQPTSARRWWIALPAVAVIGGVIALVAGLRSAQDEHPPGVVPAADGRAATPVDASASAVDATLATIVDTPHASGDDPHAPIDGGVAPRRASVRRDAGIAASVPVDASTSLSAGDAGMTATWKPVIGGNGEEKLLVLRELDVDLEHIKPLAYLPTARSHARELLPNVELFSIHMFGLAANGEVDLVSPRTPISPAVVYLFVNAGEPCGWVTVSFGRGKVILTADRPKRCSPTFAGPKCTVAQLWDKAKPTTNTVDLVVSATVGWQIGMDIYPDDCK